jgi:hypothetical protein
MEVHCNTARPFGGMTFVMISALPIRVESSPAAIIVLEDPSPQWKVGNLVLCHNLRTVVTTFSWGSPLPSSNQVSSIGLSGLMRPLRGM